MPTIKEIILPEHNSSRLLFVNIPECNNGTIDLNIEDTTDSEYCTETQKYQYNNSWLLGKLNNYIWLVEDVGQYDLNHEHTANIYYTDPNTNEKVVVYTIRRVMEYGEECDRLYMQNSGGFKLLLLDNTDNTQYANMYIKYEKYLPGCKEEVLTRNEDGKTIYGVAFYKYQNKLLGISEVISISNQLIVNTDEVDASGNPIHMNGLNYCQPTINNVNIDFSKLQIVYNLSHNTLNDIKVGVLGINSVNHKFISYKISNNCIEPSYFIVQAPKNRSWICYRSCYNSNYGVYYDTRVMPNNSTCGYLNREGSSLNGVFGNYDSVNNKYVYEINITEKTVNFNFMIPSYFTNWYSIEFMNNYNSAIPYDGYEPFDFFNELDGLYYKIYTFRPSSAIYKIIIKYNS